MGLGVERIGQYDVTPLPNGRYAVALNNGNIGAYQTDAAGVEKIRKEYEALSDEDKARINANVKYPILERSPQGDTVAFSGNGEQQVLEQGEKSKKGLLVALGLGALAIGAFILTKGKSKAPLENVVASTTEAAAKAGEEVASVTTKVAAEAGEQAAKVAETVENAASTAAKEVKISDGVTMEVLDELPKSKPDFVWGKKGYTTQKTAKTEINTAEDVLTSGTNKTGNISAELDDVLASKVSEANKGSFGQDIYNPLEPMNEYDMLSPYYKQNERLTGTVADPFDDPFNPFNPLNPTSPMNPLNSGFEVGGFGF